MKKSILKSQLSTTAAMLSAVSDAYFDAEKLREETQAALDLQVKETRELRAKLSREVSFLKHDRDRKVKEMQNVIDTQDELIKQLQYYANAGITNIHRRRWYGSKMK